MCWRIFGVGCVYGDFRFLAALGMTVWAVELAVWAVELTVWAVGLTVGRSDWSEQGLSFIVLTGVTLHDFRGSLLRLFNE